MARSVRPISILVSRITVVRARPDAIVVEMGVPGTTAPGAVHIITHGATTASGVAAAEALAGAGHGRR